MQMGPKTDIWRSFNLPLSFWSFECFHKKLFHLPSKRSDQDERHKILLFVTCATIDQPSFSTIFYSILGILNIFLIVSIVCR